MIKPLLMVAALLAWSLPAWAQISVINTWSSQFDTPPTYTSPVAVNTNTGAPQQVGDVEIGSCDAYYNGGCAGSPPAGWTSINPYSTGYSCSVEFYKVVLSGDIGATTTFPCANQSSAGIIDLRGVNNSTPIDTYGPSSGITLAQNGEALLYFVVSASNAAITPPSGFSLGWNYTGVYGTTQGYVGVYELGLSSGPTGDIEATQGGSGIGGTLIALLPASPTPSPTPTTTATPTVTATATTTATATATSTPTATATATTTQTATATPTTTATATPSPSPSPYVDLTFRYLTVVGYCHGCPTSANCTNTPAATPTPGGGDYGVDATVNNLTLTGTCTGCCTFPLPNPSEQQNHLGTVLTDITIRNLTISKHCYGCYAH
jgi:hypothetical protein